MRKSLHSPEQERLCELLRKMRLDAGLTQAEVAGRLDRPQSFVSKYETGERRLDLIELGSVCAAVGVTLTTFVEQFEAGDA